MVTYCRVMDGRDARALSIVTAGRRVVLTGEVDRDGSVGLADAFTKVADGDLWIDLSAVAYVDEAGLVVLISETRRRALQGATVFVVNPSRTVRHLFEARGLLAFLHVDETEPPGPESDLEGPGTRPIRRDLRSTFRLWARRRP